jgi:uncharacterized protein (DUF58 family)
VPPRGGRLAYVGLRRTVAAGVAPDGSGDPSSLATALHRLARAARMPGLAVVVSDFRDQDDWSRPLRLVGHRHDVLAVEVGDPREAALPAVGHLTLVDPESGRHVAVDTSRETIRSRYAEAEHARREAVARDLRGAGARHVRLSTDEPWLRGLARALDR